MYYTIPVQLAETLTMWRGGQVFIEWVLWYDLCHVISEGGRGIVPSRSCHCVLDGPISYGSLASLIYELSMLHNCYCLVKRQ